MRDEMPAGSPEAVAEAFVAAVNSEDLEAAIDLWADDALFLPVAGDPLAGKEAVRQLLRGLTSSGTKMQIETVASPSCLQGQRRSAPVAWPEYESVDQLIQLDRDASEPQGALEPKQSGTQKWYPR